jgi:hypothetical protein
VGWVPVRAKRECTKLRKKKIVIVFDPATDVVMFNSSANDVSCDRFAWHIKWNLSRFFMSAF